MKELTAREAMCIETLGGILKFQGRDAVAKVLNMDRKDLDAYLDGDSTQNSSKKQVQPQCDCRSCRSQFVMGLFNE
jgi:hypothetical protein